MITYACGSGVDGAVIHAESQTRVVLSDVANNRWEITRKRIDTGKAPAMPFGRTTDFRICSILYLSIVSFFFFL